MLGRTFDHLSKTLGNLTDVIKDDSSQLFVEVSREDAKRQERRDEMFMAMTQRFIMGPPQHMILTHYIILTLPITLTYKDLSVNLHQCMAQIVQAFHESGPVHVQLRLRATIPLLVTFWIIFYTKHSGTVNQKRQNI